MNKFKIIILSILLTAVFFLISGCNSASSQLAWSIVNPRTDLETKPVSVVVPAESVADGFLCIITHNHVIPAQAERLNESDIRLWWLVSQKKGTTVRYELSAGRDCDAPRYSWKKTGDRSAELVYSEISVIGYEYPVYDPDNIEETKKPFHHVFSPDGMQKITKGLGGLYPHHRGIYLGYNHVFVDDKKDRIDIWHARDGERSEHQAEIAQFHGPVMGGHIVLIAWKDHDGQSFIDEKREIRVFKTDNETLIIDVRSELASLRDKVVLGGDRQHAGLQFRASQYVAENRETTRFVRPDAWKSIPADVELGEDYIHNFPWNAMHFQVESQPYTVAYFSHPDNPDGAEMSERLYGRFGEFFPYELGRDESLVIQYRFQVTSGGPPLPQDVQAQYESWTEDLNIRPD